MGPSGSRLVLVGLHGSTVSYGAPHPHLVTLDCIRFKLDLPHVGPKGPQWVSMDPNGSTWVYGIT